MPRAIARWQPPLPISYLSSWFEILLGTIEIEAAFHFEKCTPDLSYANLQGTRSIRIANASVVELRVSWIDRDNALKQKAGGETLANGLSRMVNAV
jgi:hypothetical protein